MKLVGYIIVIFGIALSFFNYLIRAASKENILQPFKHLDPKYKDRYYHQLKNEHKQNSTHLISRLVMFISGFTLLAFLLFLVFN